MKTSDSESERDEDYKRKREEGRESEERINPFQKSKKLERSPVKKAMGEEMKIMMREKEEKWERKDGTKRKNEKNWRRKWKSKKKEGEKRILSQRDCTKRNVITRRNWKNGLRQN
jgi:hypothetical protein